jgi:hypothetical protein
MAQGRISRFHRDPVNAGFGAGLPLRPGPARAAKARGVKLGRKPKLTEHQKREAIRRRDHDGEPVREIARSYNVSHSTISRLTPI